MSPTKEIEQGEVEECALLEPPTRHPYPPFEAILRLDVSDLVAHSFPTVLPPPLMRMQITRGEVGSGTFSIKVEKMSPIAIEVDIEPDDEDHMTSGFSTAGFEPSQDVVASYTMTDGEGRPVDGGMTMVVTEVR
jgi:hypothetical protein